MNASAWIAVDGSFGLKTCVVEDISPSGAKLKVPGAEKLPRRFELSFSQASRHGRRCEIMWRRQQTVGVKFI